MSIQNEITTRRAKSIILNHWIYNCLPFGAIFSSIRLSSFSPIAVWLVTWLILGITHSSIYTCRDNEFCSSMREFEREMNDIFRNLDAAMYELEQRYNRDHKIDAKPYDSKKKTPVYPETFDQGAFIKDICEGLMTINLPGIMGGMASFVTIKSARNQQDKNNKN
jgi:hypothetical protein